MDGIIVFCAQYLFVSVILLAGWLWLKSPRKLKTEMILAAAMAGVIALVLSRLAAKLYYDPRPFVSGNVQPLFSHGPDNGFPSDHSWFTMTVAVLIFYYRKSFGWLALAVAVIVGSARVLAHVHSPIDIAGGFAIGILAAAVGYSLSKKLLSSRSGSKQVPDQNS